MGFIIARTIAAILLLWALDRHPYSYYTILRFVVCGVTGYGVYFAAQLEKNGWAWAFGIIALLFNPIIPIHLARLIHKLRLKNEFDLRIKGNWIFERCKATASGKASLEY